MLYNDRNYANCTNTNCVTSGRSDTVGDQNFCDVGNAFVAMNTAGGNIRYRVEERESGLFQRVPPLQCATVSLPTRNMWGSRYRKCLFNAGTAITR